MRFEAIWCEQCHRNPLNPEAKNQCRHLFKAMTIQNNGHWWALDGDAWCDAFKSREDANAKRRAKNVVKDNRQMELFL